MKAAIVADNAAHASAIMLWSRYDAADWAVVLYGDEIADTYSLAVLARPIRDITEDHALWVSYMLRPRVIGRISTIPGWDFNVSPTLQIEDMRDEPALRSMWN